MELWHHLPRAQAAGSGEKREVFLGSGSAPLQDVLRRLQVGRLGSSAPRFWLAMYSDKVAACCA